MFDIHPDLRSVKAHSLPTNRVRAKRHQRFTQCGKLAPTTQIQSHPDLRSSSGSGGHLIPTLVIRPDGLQVQPRQRRIYYSWRRFL